MGTNLVVEEKSTLVEYDIRVEDILLDSKLNHDVI